VRGFGESWEHYARMAIGSRNKWRSEIFLDSAALVSFNHAQPISSPKAVRYFLLFLIAGMLFSPSFRLPTATTKITPTNP